MAKLNPALLSKVQTGSVLPRINAAEDKAQFLATANTRLDALFLVTEDQVLKGARLSGIIPQGGAQAQALFGKDGAGKEHKSVQTQVAFATKQQIADIKAQLAVLSTTATLEDCKTKFFELLDEIRIQLVVWAETEPKAYEALSSGRGTFAASLRVDPVLGIISLSQAEAEGYSDVVKIPRRSLETSMQDTTQPVVVMRKMKDGSVKPESEIMAQFAGVLTPEQINTMFPVVA